MNKLLVLLAVFAVLGTATGVGWANRPVRT